MPAHEGPPKAIKLPDQILGERFCVTALITSVKQHLKKLEFTECGRSFLKKFGPHAGPGVPTHGRVKGYRGGLSCLSLSCPMG